MVESKIKSRTFRRVKRKTPRGEVVIHFERKNQKKPVCGVCGAILQGIKHTSQKDINKLSKTQRRPERAFGGVLCSKCSREKIKSIARGLK
jgi:large subunit ribosomal protein L34e